ncbi:MAG: hypothetical protein U5K69_22545 [Balneolaceae bacterium]|nr:hypothetical protein [Balneolaceae bacterium]
MSANVESLKMNDGKYETGNEYDTILFEAGSVYRAHRKSLTPKWPAAVARAVVGLDNLAKGVWHMLTRNQEYKGCKGQPVRAASQTCWPSR